jgi:hypothetical protein
LGERLLCKQEVVGSIPSGSTNFIFLALPRFALLERAQIRGKCCSCQEPKFSGRYAACHIFYIVKRGST